MHGAAVVYEPDLTSLEFVLEFFPIRFDKL